MHPRGCLGRPRSGPGQRPRAYLSLARQPGLVGLLEISFYTRSFPRSSAVFHYLEHTRIRSNTSPRQEGRKGPGAPDGKRLHLKLEKIGTVLLGGTWHVFRCRTDCLDIEDVAKGCARTPPRGGGGGAFARPASCWAMTDSHRLSLQKGVEGVSVLHTLHEMLIAARQTS